MKVDLKYVIIIAIACLIAGGVLYPSKTIDERVRQTYQEKIDKLTTEKSTLQIEHALKEIAQFKQSLIKQAEEKGANAIIATRYITAQVSAGAAEILAYGTAVIVK